ncbi:protein phosphatase 2C domain-containing protein [Actinophytocola sediminis]
MTAQRPALGTAGDQDWRGEFRFTPYQVGDPGRAANAPAYPDTEFWDCPDTVLDGFLLRGDGATPPMVLRAASVRGRAHRFYGKVRQDAYAFRADRRYAVLAIADGIGNAPLSHFAALVATRHGCYEILKQLATTPPSALNWTWVLRVLAAKVVTEGRRQLATPDLTEHDVAAQLAATVLFAVVGLEPVDGCHPVHLLAYGDSSAWILRGGQHWEPQQAVKNDGVDIASSATVALPNLPPHPPVPVHTTIAPADMLLLVSDGIGDPLGNGTGTVGAFLAQHWRRPPEPLAFAAQVDFARKSHDDDRTAVAIWPGVG